VLKGRGGNKATYLYMAPSRKIPARSTNGSVSAQILHQRNELLSAKQETKETERGERGKKAGWGEEREKNGLRHSYEPSSCETFWKICESPSCSQRKKRVAKKRGGKKEKKVAEGETKSSRYRPEPGGTQLEKPEGKKVGRKSSKENVPLR